MLRGGILYRGIFLRNYKKQFVRNKILQVVGTKEELKNNKLILKVNYVTCKGLKNVIFEFDVSEVKLKLK